MRFTVELDNFWLDEEEDITSALKGHIINEVVHKIKKDIADKVDKQIAGAVKLVMDSSIQNVIDGKLSEFVASGMIVQGSKEVSITDHLKQLFVSNNGWNNPRNQLETLAKKFGKEMKVQYNAAFANMIVANMKEQGFLKDEVAQILLGEKKD